MIEKYRKHYMWRDSDLNDKKTPLAAWNLATKLKKEGGLGIINLQTQNDALFNKLDCPWVSLVWENYYSNRRPPDHRPRGSFWWRAVLKLLNKFKGISIVQIQNGATISLWQDLWNGQVRHLALPELFSFSNGIECIVNQAKNMLDLHDIFQLSLTPEAF
jgi:hypothetical protein